MSVDNMSIQRFSTAMQSFLFKVVKELDQKWPDVEDSFQKFIQHQNGTACELLQELLQAIQELLISVEKRQKNQAGNAVENSCQVLRQHAKYETDNKSSAYPQRLVDSNLVQIKANNSEINRRISAFIERKQKEVDDINVREFCGVLHPHIQQSDNSCARTDAVFVPRSDCKSHVKVSKVSNSYGPQTRLLQPESQSDTPSSTSKTTDVVKPDPDTMCYPGKNMSSRLAPTEGIEERLNNLEHHVKLERDNKDVFKRLKALEERLLYLESVSPEYFSFMPSAPKRHKKDSGYNKPKHKSLSQVRNVGDINVKISQLKMKLLSKQIKEEPAD